MRSVSSEAASLRSDSATARLPCTHFGSMLLSQGLLVGSQQGIIWVPALPSRLAVSTQRLCSRSQLHTCRLTCQEALSQMSTSTALPSAARRLHTHSK